MIAGIVAGGAHRRQSGTGWTPADLAPQLWLDDQSVVVISGSNLTSWRNRGSLAGSFSASGTAPSIITVGGIRVARFESAHMFASSELHSLARGTPCAWIYAVYKKRGTDTSDINRPVLVGLTSGGGYLLGLAAGGNQSGAKNKPSTGGRRVDSGSYSGVNSERPIVGSTLQSYGQLDYENRQISMRIQGAEAGSLSGAFDAAGNSAPSSLSSLRLGYDLGTYADVDLIAVLAGGTRLATESVQKLEGWAAHRYGLAASLPNEHPYKSAPPA